MKFWEIPREKQIAILREDISIRQRSGLDFEYDLPQSHIVYETPKSISETALESYISDTHKRRTLIAVLYCLSSPALESCYKISVKWGIEIFLGHGDHIICKNKNKLNDSKLLYINLESLTDIKFEEFHPYAQGTPARIQMLTAVALFFYGVYIGNALRV